ncbi:hypothetical protein ACE01N_15960 [Saccharicrinis sp. FJH2]|uniref:hypothetical protein n=1 Tax=Saccharicrinis sp. FJH65 TaxID=3344659 RepID=UPI0035F3262D
MIEIKVSDKLHIQKYHVSELAEFVSGDYYRNLNIKPISPQRVQSYIHNPRSVKDHISLYLLISEKRLIAFRTVFADQIVLGKKLYNFGWCSGNWVDPDERRKGYSDLLLREMYEDWEGRLMYTNYADASHKLYHKTGQFKLLSQRTGARFYGNIDVKTFTSGREEYKLINAFSFLIDPFITSYAKIKARLFSKYDLSAYSVYLDSSPTISFLNNCMDTISPLKRAVKEFKWIFNYPWVSTDKSDRINYPFTSYLDAFEYLLVTLVHKVSGEETRLILSRQKGNLKFLYRFGSAAPDVMAEFLMNYCAEHKIKTLTVLDSELAEKLKSLKSPFIKYRPFSMNIYASFAENENAGLTFQDGDGDVVFT